MISWVWGLAACYDAYELDCVTFLDGCCVPFVKVKCGLVELNDDSFSGEL